MSRLCFLSIFLLLIGCGSRTEKTDLNKIPERIISLAPNITETIYALGLENKLVGTTPYCTFPEAAYTIQKVGGFGQYNYEAIVTLNPDLVILHKEYDADKKRLDGLGIPYLETGSYFIADILQTITDIGTACGAEPQASDLTANLNRRIAVLSNHQENHQRVLLTFNGSADAEVEQVHAFGTECIHNELLELAGGINVVSGTLPYSVLSREAILRLNPDIIIELAPGQPEVDNPIKVWKKFTAVNAVKNKQVYYLTGDYTCIPGPRFIQTLEDLSGILKEHP